MSSQPTAVNPNRQLPAPATGSSRRSSERGRLSRSLLTIGLIVVIGLTVLLLTSLRSAPTAGRQLTHAIKRSDLRVAVVEQGLLESAENLEIKCQVRGWSTVLWVIESGTKVKPGDELVRLDQSIIQEQIDERTKYAHWSRSAAERSAANLARAKIAIGEYEQGRYVSELMGLEKDLIVANGNLQSAEQLLSYAQMMEGSEYISELELEAKEFAVDQARLEVDLKQTELDVLRRFTRAEQEQTLTGNLAAAEANHKANVERAIADASRRDRAIKEIQHCVVRADRAGLVIHPSAAQWELAPIAEGTAVHTNQVLLVMPDLSQMQVKVGVHESVIDRVKPEQPVLVALADRTLEGKVSTVASVTRPAGWWTGNEVRYDVTIQLPADKGLMPGMSAEVEILLARHSNELTIPVAAVVETSAGQYCWVKSASGFRRCRLELGDTNKVFAIVAAGLQEGDEVLLNPMALEGPQSGLLLAKP